MRKAILLAALLLCAFLVGAQGIVPKDIIWDNARFTLAGPDKIYVRNVGYLGSSDTFSVVLTLSMVDNALYAALEGPFTAETKLVPDNAEVVYAVAGIDATSNLLKISPIIGGDGMAYAASFQWDGATGLNLKGLDVVDYPTTYQDLLVAKNLLKNMVADTQAKAAADKAAAAKALTDAVAAEKAKGDKAVTDAAAAKAALTKAQADLAAAQATADQARKDAAVAKTTADQLKVELTLLKSQATGGKSLPTIDPSKLDFSMARASIAGPNSLYLRAIQYAGESVSVLLNLSADGSVTVTGPWFADEKLIQDSYEVAYLGISPVGTYSLELSPVIMDGLAYSGILEWNPGTNELAIVQYNQVAMPDRYEDLAVAVTGSRQTVLAAKDNADTYKAQAETSKAQAASYKAAADKANEDVAELNKQIDDLKAKLAEAPTAPGVAAVMPVVEAAVYEKPSMITFSGFEGGKAAFGKWKETSGILNQSDATLKYAKYVLPLEQNQTEMLFEFTAKAKEIAWVGYGLHFLASGDKKSNGYGFGSSYLVWLTRDVNVYQIPTTFVQFYQSFDDGKMVQLASVNIPEAIGDELQTEVIYNSEAKTVNISVNGVTRLVYSVSSALTMGDKVALRTLNGPVDFTEFAVKTR